MQTERRRYPRKALKNLAYINIEPNNGGIVVDVSEGGLRFHSVGPISAAGEVKFWFSMRSTDHLDAVGELVWTDDTRKTGGIRFVQLPYDVRAKLRSMLGSVSFDPKVPAQGVPNSSSAPSPLATDQSATAKETLAMEQELEAMAPRSYAASGFGSSLGYAVSGAADAIDANQSSAAAVAEPARDAQRAHILNSPLSLLATPETGTNGAEVYRQSMKPHVLTGMNDAEEREHRFRPFLVVVLIAAVLTAAGYYVYRWKTDLNASASQRLTSSPANVAGTEPATSSSANQPPPATLPLETLNSASAASAPLATQPASTAGAPSSSTKTNGPTLGSGGDLSAAQGSVSGSANPSTGGSGLAPVAPEGAPGSSVAGSTTTPKTDSISARGSHGTKSKRGEASARDAAVANANDVDTGEAELDEARALLNGTNGRRNPAAAVKILWSAVEKGSVAAEIELAGIFQRGDGVPKNCEQARVLLQAATSHGSQVAADQLAVLVRQGCRR